MFYVVWKGRIPGVYYSWRECEQQIKEFKGAKFKGFKTKAEAEEAFLKPAELYLASGKPGGATLDAAGLRRLPKEVNLNSIAVDAACSGNPGLMEYRGVFLGNQEEVFHFGPMYGTNNVGEFLAIVHALALCKRNKWKMTIYSDSWNALLWVRQKKCNTRLKIDERTKPLYELIRRAEIWLKTNDYITPLLKWQTDAWGEIPADFGRK